MFFCGAGRLYNRIEPRIVATFGIAIMTAVLSVFISLSPDTPSMIIVGTLLLLGLGYALFSSLHTNAIISSVEKQYLGIASRMGATMRSIGQVLSVAIAMFFLSVVLGAVAVSAVNFLEFITAVRLAFLIFAAVYTIGMFASYSQVTIR